MSRADLRAIARLQNDIRFQNVTVTQARRIANNPANIRTIGERDPYSGKLLTHDINGGEVLTFTITSGFLAARNQIIPASFGNGSFQSSDGKPASANF
jgi:hypothetical protein